MKLKKSYQKIIGIGLIIIATSTTTAILYFELRSDRGLCDGACYIIENSIDLGIGGYPRGIQVDDLLLSAYSNGSFVLEGYNLTDEQKIGPKVIIPDSEKPTARATLFFSEALDFLICVFNHDNAASCGIAWVDRDAMFDPMSWSVQYHLVGPVSQEFFHIGLWEPYLAYYNSSTSLLYFSNQTIYDTENPIDDTGYSFTLDGYDVVQKIDTFWIEWNGTGFESKFCGTVSDDLLEGTIHYKDGMASSVIVDQKVGYTDYIMTFETFPPPEKDPNITMVKFRVNDTGIESLWRKQITVHHTSAPFVSIWDGYIVVSYKFHADSQQSIGFIGMKNDESTFSHPIYLNEELYGWPSIFSDSSDNLWLVAENQTNSAVTLTNISLSFHWIT